MRPSSEGEAIDFLKRCRFTISGSNIKPPPGNREVSVAQADAIDFLSQEHGYALDDSPQPDKGPEFYDDNQAIVFLIWYEDTDRQLEMFHGEGAEEAARKTLAKRSVNWACHLFVRIDAAMQETKATKTT